MKRVGKILALSFVLGLFLTFNAIQVKAGTDTDEIPVTELNQIMTTLTDCDARKRPKESAETVISFEAGSPVWIIGETQDGWYKVSYQKLEGYIPKDCVTELQVEVGEQGTMGLREADSDEEMEALEAENKLVIEEIERQRTERRRSYIWITVIVVLVVGIFATGIIATMKADKDKKKKAANNVEMIDLDSEEEHG